MPAASRYISGTYLSLGTQQAYSSGSQVAPPTFSQNGPTLTISDATSGATIYYTTDGSTPTTGSPVYSGPIALSTSTYVTTYTYDKFNHLINVSMPRPSGTQTRTFFYTGNDLTSTTNPENGTVNYTYDSNHRMLTKTDAKNQQTVFTYDSYGRTTEIQRFYFSGGTFVEDTSQQVDYYFDANPFDSTYSQYTAGRLAAVQYLGGNCTSLGPPRTGCDTIEEMYSYNVGGAMVGKRVRLIRGSNQVDLNGSWSYDTEGRMTQVVYPGWSYQGTAVGGSNYTYAYDSMGRLSTMNNYYPSTSLISGVTYGVANEVQAITGSLFNETRSYNSLFQLAQITVPGALNIQYAYSSTMNNGKVASQTDVISGEQVVYTYDALNRLATAQTVTNPAVTQWGQSYNYDGFGNLTAQNVIKGSAPTMSVTYNAATNRQTGDTADANGNLGPGYLYDMANRLLQPSGVTIQYAYAPGNKRVWRGNGSTLDEIAFWSPNGQKLATYQVAGYSGALNFNLTGTDVYFGSRLIAKGTNNYGSTNDWVTLASVATDRLGSIGKFYPYGIERPSATTNDTEKFTGYYRDAATGLDYADQRYHQPGVGRFMSPDPSANPTSPAAPSDQSTPQSWNRYAYALGDPINNSDPTGTDSVTCDPFSDPTCDPGDPGDPGYPDSPSPDPGTPSSFTLNCPTPTVLTQLGQALGASLDICQTTIFTADGSSVTDYSLIVPLSSWDQLAGAANGFLGGQLAAAGGITIALDGEVTIGVIAGTLAAPEVLITIAVIGAAYEIYHIEQVIQRRQSQAGQTAELNKALAKYKQQCGATLTRAQRGQLHTAITKQDYTPEEILELIIAMFGCPNPQ